MTEYIQKKDGSPFPTEKAANLRRGVLRKQGKETQVVEVEGGFALEVTGKRKRRVPLGRRNVLQYPEREGYMRRVVNDTDDRIMQFQEAGWEVVKNSDLPSGDPRAGDASQQGMPVSKPVGGGVKGVLMEIPEEWFNEDQQAKQDHIKQMEDDMKREKGGVPGAYGGMEIT